MHHKLEALAQEGMTPVLKDEHVQTFRKDLDEAYSDWNKRARRELADVLGLDSASTEGIGE